MSDFVINGGNPISGTTTPMPNKNSVVAIIPAIIAFDEPVTLRNVPMSASVRVLLTIFKELGGRVEYIESGVIKLDPTFY